MNNTTTTLLAEMAANLAALAVKDTVSAVSTRIKAIKLEKMLKLSKINITKS
ncbi:hypothetical protein LR021_02880 [Candidatus Bipolaricaulota bacterium]|nr:hypothetical protein [Candidatus Bipolaricaulota bacterium]